jgi:formyl-CoA transferase
MGQPDLAHDARFTGNANRVRNVEDLDRIIEAWTSGLTAEEADRRLTEADVPCTLIYTAADCAADPQFRHRGMVQEVEDPTFGRPVLHAGIVPHVADNPGAVRWPGPPVGAHTEEVLRELLGLGGTEIEGLCQEKVL